MSQNSNRKYSIVDGFFAQDDPNADAKVIGAIPARFGLLDDSPERWKTFQARIASLNSAAAPGTAYKVFFFSRHGEGVHNVGERKYGTTAWDDSWSKLCGDETLVWGPDPDLTSVGVGQAVAAAKLWKDELQYGVPLPQKHYASPMRRALHTFQETFLNGNLVDASAPCTTVTILENLREEYGEHTCDLRRPRSVIGQDFPPPIYHFEEGFAEDDILWKAEQRETKAHVKERARQVLDLIFAHNNETYICITAHSGIINGFVANFGRGRYGLPTGGILPLVIKAVNVR